MLRLKYTYTHTSIIFQLNISAFTKKLRVGTRILLPYSIGIRMVYTIVYIIPSYTDVINKHIDHSCMIAYNVYYY